MSDESVIKESFGRRYRVRLVTDENPDEPYDDGSVPLWRVEARNYHWTAKQVETTSYEPSCAGLADALNRWGGPGSHLVERWLKSYHGATIVETWHSGEAWYIAADHEDWRKTMGVTPEQIRKEYSEGASLMSEYKAWCAGDVHGYVIERRVVAYATLTEPADGKIIGSRRTEEWIPVEDGDGSMYGLYGYEYAVKTAEEALNLYVDAADRREYPGRYEKVTLAPPVTED